MFPVVATTGRGFGPLKAALAAVLDAEPPRKIEHWQALRTAADELLAEFRRAGRNLHHAEIERALIDGTGDAALPVDLEQRLTRARAALFEGKPPLAVEARTRYRWVSATLAAVQSPGSRIARRGAALLDWINRPWPSTALFVLTLGVVFQAVFAWATYFMDLIDAGFSGLSAGVSAFLPSGIVASFLADGVIAGVGSVIIFLPQIMILFLFIILIEDSGYLARAAYLMDRVMRSVGLSGQSIIPMISSFACAVPGIMATRVIPNRTGSLCHDPGGAVHDLFGAAARLCAAHRRVHPGAHGWVPESAGAGVVRPVSVRHHRWVA